MTNRQWRVTAVKFSGELIIELILKSLHSLTLEVGILARREDVYHIDVAIENLDCYGRKVPP